MNRKIIILLPVHNRKDITRKFLECLINQTYQNYHLILIDDGCTDDTVEMAKSLIRNITILSGNGHLWWAGSLQLGYKYLRKTKEFKGDDVVLIINDDVSIKKDFLEIAAELIEQNKENKIIFQAIAVDKNTGKKELPGVFYNNKFLSFEPTEDIDKINCLSTRGLFLRIIDFIESGGFHPRLLPHYLSDYEFTNRLITKRKLTPVVEERLNLKSFSEMSGFENQMEKKTFFKYFKDLFSKKNKLNPLHWTFFILLTACFPYNLRNIYKIFYNNIRQLAVIFFRSIRI